MTLRVRVMLAAVAGMSLLAVLVAGSLIANVRTNSYRNLDDRLDAASATIAALTTAISAEPKDGLLITVRIGPDDVRSVGPTIPHIAGPRGFVTINGAEYRVRQRSLKRNGKTIVEMSAAFATDPVEKQIERTKIRIVGATGSAILLSVILSWLLGTYAAVPIRRLVATVRRYTPENPPVFSNTGTGEVAELAQALNTMLGRIDSAQAARARALEASRDFAASAAHELRSPLTAMRTNLDVLTSAPNDEVTRSVLHGEIRGGLDRIADTLAALEALAVGQSVTGQDFDQVDLTELLDRLVSDMRGQYPKVQIVLSVPDEVLIRAFAPGLRTAVRNAVTNAVVHGNSELVNITTEATLNGVMIVVEDSGRGIPAAEQQSVFGRFSRGSNAIHPGAGLGLALVEQVAETHGGSARILNSEHGGVRLEIRLGSGK
ncbi:putative two-component histidine kinase [Gordonia effusa NBRC 100432]|uniref:histidine kinase n=1 Tax=Gordonia effusa NBRC 100432 TaxID=1077974 RepID=H0R5U4_9ACTN|nr:HAMP domain-containing sensor histidine kinase [Gordonia effusa]GAB20445.1 putative two-component histidine kinase [Gordonia effusa NBRC 100432]